MTMLLWVVGILGAAVVLVIAGVVYLAVILAWEEQHTVGLAYYGLPVAERRRFRRWLRVHARLLRPVVRIAARFTKVNLANAGFRYQGVSGPKGSCSEESFRAGHAYTPRPGTSSRGHADEMRNDVDAAPSVRSPAARSGHLAERGEAMYAVLPWLEGRKSVSVAGAPLVGEERPSRIIKTHFPADLCPLSDDAKYIYVVRHPCPVSRAVRTSSRRT